MKMDNSGSRIENGIIDRKILYPGQPSTLIKDCEPSTKVTFHFQTLYTNKDGSEVVLDDSRKLSKPMELILGKQFRLPIIEELIKSMCVNEVSRFEISKKLLINYPYMSAQYRKFAKYPIECKVKSGSSCCARTMEQGVGYDDLDELMIKPRDLIFIFEILKCERNYNKEIWEMNEMEKTNELMNLKTKGNEFYKKLNYFEAEKCYLKALAILSNLQIKHAPKSDEYIELQKIEILLNSNMAQLRYKQDQFYESIQYCDKVLKVDKANVKMYYRRAQANARIWNQTEAERDYEQVIKLDSKMENVVRKELKELKEKIKMVEQEENEKLGEKLFEMIKSQKNE